MITRLYLNNCYTHHDKTFTFETGLTGIIGPNESGKSLIQEMIRYALFGSAALRATAPKDLHVELDFEVAGTSYTVVRKGRNATLGALAAGTKPVNEAIIKILGYDLQVFDVANSCNQGAVEALTDMRPAERKAMVDRTVGLDTLDAVIAYCGTRGNALKSEAMGMKAALVEPVEPTVPEGYLPSDQLKAELTKAADRVRELNQIRGFLSRPVMAPLGPRPRSVEELRSLRHEAMGDVLELQKLRGQLSHVVPAPSCPSACPIEEPSEQLEAYQQGRAILMGRKRALQAEIGGIAPEVFTAAELDARETHLNSWDQWQERQRLLAQGHICCPACNHTWPVAGNIPDLAEVEKPSFTRGDLASHRARLGNNERLAKLQLEHDAIADQPDRAQDLRTRLSYEAQLASYERAAEAYAAYNAALPALQARAAELEGADERRDALETEHRLATLWAQYDEYEAEAEPKRNRARELDGCEAGHQYVAELLALSQAYERDQASYKAQLVIYQSRLADWQDRVTRSEAYLKARMDIVDLKTKVKSHLLPSLNRVASILLTEMTGGARSLVEIDDEFDIKIDGAPVGTLSGSGKAVSNLAIRIALGHILTNRVFSLFMADEIDGSMDAERADYVAQALRRLTGRVRQVVLITHKRPETDHKIELKK